MVLNPGVVADAYVNDLVGASPISTLFPAPLPTLDITYIFRLAWDCTKGAGSFRVNGVQETTEFFAKGTPWTPFVPRFLWAGKPGGLTGSGRVVRTTLSSLYLP